MASEVREDYLEALQSLTVNSRPIIKTLTEIAHECQEYADAVCDALEAHTMQCAPAYKLPAMYLIDSICKSSKARGDGVYATKLERRIVLIFTAAFDSAAEPVRLKLNELFKTWTAPLPPSNQPLFAHDVLRQLNDFMIAGSGAQTAPPLAPQLAPPRQRLTQSMLVVEINRLRNLLEQDPADPHNEMQLSLLARYESEISGVVDPKQLPVLQTQLEELKSNRERHLNSGMAGVDRHRKERRTNSGRRGTPGGVDKITGANNVPLGQRRRNTQRSRSDNFAKDQNQHHQHNHNHHHGSGSARGGESSGPRGSGSHDDEKRDDGDDYAQPHTDENPGLALEAACATDATEDQISALYGKLLPLQCATCGHRFKDTEAGRQAKQNEMDWHFRANKDIREGHSRNRCWFLSLQMWVEYRDENEVEGGGAALEYQENGVAGDANHGIMQGTGSAPLDLEQERKKYIDVPSDSTAVCPVCQEPHETSWSEEAENWVWMNAVEVQGRYFHATCYADPQNTATVKEVLETM